jgi:hypothetical protein
MSSHNQSEFNRRISTPIGILIVVALAVLVGGFAIWQVKKEGIKISQVKLPEKIIKEETASWKTYRNEKLKFEIKYPPDLVFEKPFPYTSFYFDFIMDSSPIHCSSKEKSSHRISLTVEINSFENSVLKEWNKMRKEYVEKLEKGEWEYGAYLEAPNETWIDPSILKEKTGTPCNIERSFSKIYDCKVVKLKNKKFIRFLEDYFYAPGLMIAYRTADPKGERWFSIILMIEVNTEGESLLERRDCLGEFLIRILNNKKKPEGELENIIFQKIKEFNQMVSTFQFLE